MLPWARWRVCAAHQLLRARELDLARCGLKTHGLLKLSHALQRLSQHIEDHVPQPAHTSQSASW